jgi:hypothetical protein
LGGKNNSATGEGTVILGCDTCKGSRNYSTYVDTLIINPKISAPLESKGMIYFNDSDKHFYGYDGINWIQLDN